MRFPQGQVGLPGEISTPSLSALLRHTLYSIFFTLIIWQTLLLPKYISIFFIVLALWWPNFRQLTPEPLILASEFPILEEYLVKLRLFMPYPEQKARFENICFKAILFYVRNLKIYVVQHTLSRLNISHVDRTPAIPTGWCPKFFSSCSRYTTPSTKHGDWSGLQIDHVLLLRNTPSTSSKPAKILRRPFVTPF